VDHPKRDGGLAVVLHCARDKDRFALPVIGGKPTHRVACYTVPDSGKRGRNEKLPLLQRPNHLIFAPFKLNYKMKSSLVFMPTS
jgi:hypothetical protein